MLNYKHLRYFRAVAHEGNLTRAAERLNLSQSALSVQIRALEAQLGHALFDRVGRRLELTEAGRIALDHADTIFKTGDELVGTLSQAGRSRRPLRVGALSTLSRNFQIAFLRPLLGRQEVEVVLKSGSLDELLRGLEALNLDVVLTNQTVGRDSFAPYSVTKLDEQPVSLIGVPERVPPGAAIETIVAEEPLILPTPETALRAGFDAVMERLSLRPVIAAEVDDIAMMRLLAREGAGVAVLPPIAVRDELEAGILSLGPEISGLTESFYAITLRRRFPNPLLREVLSRPTEGDPV